MYGPGISYVAESYDGLSAEGATCLISDAETLASTVIALQDLDQRQLLIDGAARAIKKRRGVLLDTWAALELLLLKNTPG